jgi:gliding motility-associated-like protein
MKSIIFILFFWSLTLLGQQTFELCPGELKTINYFSETNSVGTNIWSVNGTTYIGDTLVYTFNQPGLYNIGLVRENVLCSVEESYNVLITPCIGVIYWIPNAFTPDNNEFNQTFKPIFNEGIDIDGFSFTIYNRWGQLIWETEDLNVNWDGTYNNRVCSDGVYIWNLKFNVKNNDEKRNDHGHIVLIR